MSLQNGIFEPLKIEAIQVESLQQKGEVEEEAVVPGIKLLTPIRKSSSRSRTRGRSVQSPKHNPKSKSNVEGKENSSPHQRVRSPKMRNKHEAKLRSLSPNRAPNSELLHQRPHAPAKPPPHKPTLQPPLPSSGGPPSPHNDDNKSAPTAPSPTAPLHQIDITTIPVAMGVGLTPTGMAVQGRPLPPPISELLEEDFKEDFDRYVKEEERNRELFDQFGVENISDEDLTALWQNYDLNEDSYLDEYEIGVLIGDFFTSLKRMIPQFVEEHTNNLDEDVRKEKLESHDDFLGEVAEQVCSYFVTIPRKQITRDFIKKADLDRDGRLSKDEFIASFDDAANDNMQAIKLYVETIVKLFE